MTIPVTKVRHRSSDLLRGMLEERLYQNLNWLTEHASDAAPADGDSATPDARVAAARRGVAETTAALRRMAEGTYGVCASCGKNIPLGRLRNVPHARFCIPCQRRTATRRRRRPAPAHPRS